MSEHNTNEAKSPKRGKTNGYNSAHLHAKHNRKRQEADSRQQEHNTLTLNEKIDKVRSRRGNSKRELARLLKEAVVAGVVVVEPKAVASKKTTKKVAKKKTAK
jgi:hypothetical protein